MVVAGTWQALPSATDRGGRLLSTRGGGCGAATAALPAAVASRARGGRVERVAHSMHASLVSRSRRGRAWWYGHVASAAKRDRSRWQAAQHAWWWVWCGYSRTTSSCSASRARGVRVGRVAHSMHASLVSRSRRAEVVHGGTGTWQVLPSATGRGGRLLSTRGGGYGAATAAVPPAVASRARGGCVERVPHSMHACIVSLV